MRKYLKYIIGVVTVLAVAAVVVYKITADKDAGAQTSRQNVPMVKIEKPTRETVTLRLQFTGDMSSIQQTNIFSKVSGNLEHVYVNLGSQVKQGQSLALIDTTELHQQFEQVAATFSNAQLTYQRTKELFDQNLVAKQDLDNAEATMKIARANFETAGTRLNYAKISAPFSGFITKRYFDPGVYITPTNATLFTLMDIDSVKVTINVLEKDIPLVTKGKKATITVDAFPDKEFYGSVTRYANAVDLSTRTMQVEIDVQNKENMLKPGMFANVVLVLSEHPDALTIATQGILRDDKGYYIYAVENGTARRIQVDVGVEQNGRTEILSGLNGTENVITTGQQFARDGGQVLVQK
jgi:RND family efflux transporter MFP subunit